jgi:hypothetical protein
LTTEAAGSSLIVSSPGISVNSLLVIKLGQSGNEENRYDKETRGDSEPVARSDYSSAGVVMPKGCGSIETNAYWFSDSCYSLTDLSSIVMVYGLTPYLIG